MIDYDRFQNDEAYMQETLNDIKYVTDQRTLSDILKELSFKIYNKRINPEKATILLNAVRTRMNMLSSGRKNGMSGFNNSQGRQMTLSPTSISNNSGRVSIIFLVVNVAIITAMYVMLLIR